MSEGGLAGTAFVDLVPRFGAGFGAGLASKLKSLAAPAAVIGIGAGLFSIGEKFEKTFNAIRVQTGATGGVFEKLKGDAKNVLAGTAGSFDQVSAAVGGLFQRTRLTGPALDDLAKKEVTLGRITKTDVGANVEATTSLFNRYGISAKNQGAALDVLFKASQAGGKGIGTLTGELQKGAPALEAYGFGFDKSAALVASLERAGVNVTPVLTGLRTAFGKIAKEGKDPQAVLRGIFKELRDGKDPTKATADAIKLFGARGGAELSSAIKAGRFDVDGLLKTITNGKDGILETGSAVSTIGGKFARLKNIALVALEPIGTKLVEVATAGVGKLVDGVVAAGPIIGGAFTFIREKASALFSIIAEKLAPTFDRIRTTAARVFSGVRDAIANFGDFVHGNAAGIGVAIGRIFGFQEDSSQTDGIIHFAQSARDALATFLTKAREVGAGVAAALGRIDFGAIFGRVREVVAGVVTAIKGIDFGAIFGRLKDIVAPILPPLLELGHAVIDLAVAAFPVLRQAIGDIIGFGIKLKPVFIGIVAAGYILARVAGVLIAGALKLTAKATELLAHHAGILRPILIGLVAGFVALKVVRGVQAGILGVAKAAGTAYGTMQRLGGQAATVFKTLKSGVSTVASVAKSFLTGAVNIARQTAAFLAQKVAAIATAVATKAMAAAQWLLNAAMDANPITLIVAGIAALAAGIVLAYQHFEPFRNVVQAVGRALATVARVITEGLGAAFSWVKGHWPLLLAILTGPFGLAVLAITRNWGRIKDGAATAFHAITGFFTRLPAVILGTLGKAGSWLLDVGKKIIGGLGRGLTAALGAFLGFYVRLPLYILEKLAKAGTWLLGVGKRILIGLGNGVVIGAGKVLDWIGGLKDRVLHYLGNAGRWLYDIGKKIISGLLDGIKHGIGSVKDFLGGVGSSIISWKGPPAKDAKLLIPTGGIIIDGLLKGLRGALPAVEELLGGVTDLFANTKPELGLKAPTVVTAPRVDPKRFAAAFRPPPPAPTDRPLERAGTAIRALDQATGDAPTGEAPIHQENHFHGHDQPSAADVTYSGRQLAWLVTQTGRRP